MTTIFRSIQRIRDVSRNALYKFSTYYTEIHWVP